jgi:hypothetical protein
MEEESTSASSDDEKTTPPVAITGTYMVCVPFAQGADTKTLNIGCQVREKEHKAISALGEPPYGSWSYQLQPPQLAKVTPTPPPAGSPWQIIYSLTEFSQATLATLTQALVVNLQVAPPADAPAGVTSGTLRASAFELNKPVEIATERTRSCNSAQLPDPDGDGWATENGTPCKIRAANEINTASLLTPQQRLTNAGGTNVARAGYDCTLFVGKPWFDAGGLYVGIYSNKGADQVLNGGADEYIWTCDQTIAPFVAWKASCPKAIRGDGKGCNP